MTRFQAFTSDTFRSLQIRNFRLFFGGQLISQIGNWMTMVVQALLVFRITGSGVALGFLAAAQFGPVLLIGPWAGLVADRSDKRKLLLVVQSIAMGQSFLLAALAFAGDPPVAGIFAIALLGGVTVAFDNPARRAFVVEMVPADDMPNAVSLNSALMTGARVIGPAVGGLLVTTVGFGWTFLVDGLSYFAVLACLYLMNPAGLHPSVITTRARGQVRAGLRYARSVPELFIPLAMMGVIGTLAFNFQTVLPVFAGRDLEGTDVTFTVLMSVISFGSLVGALATARRRSIDLQVVALSAIAFGAAMALLSVAPNLTTAYAVGVLVGISSISFMTASTAIVQTQADPSMRGRVLALQSMLFLGSTPIGGPIVGAISEHWGARYSLALGAGATIITGVVGLIAARRSTPTARAGDANPGRVVDVADAAGSPPIEVAARQRPGVAGEVRQAS